MKDIDTFNNFEFIVNFDKKEHFDNLNQYRKDIEEKNKIIFGLQFRINEEMSRVVICDLCKRKFANKAHFLKHVNLSELHRQNVNKLNY
jgi:hypothetical protein